MSERDKTIEEIRKLCRVKIGRKKGLLMRSYEGMEVGIQTYNYDVLSSEGYFSGYWTGQRPKLADKTIVNRIVDTEDCQECDTFENKELQEFLRFLREHS